MITRCTSATGTPLACACLATRSWYWLRWASAAFGNRATARTSDKASEVRVNRRFIETASGRRKPLQRAQLSALVWRKAGFVPAIRSNPASPVYPELCPAVLRSAGNREHGPEKCAVVFRTDHAQTKGNFPEKSHDLGRH